MRAMVPILLSLLLGACGAGESEPRLPQRDPATAQALSDQILVDPDLAHQNEGNAALTVSSDHSLPLLVSTPEAIAAARAEAAELVGGADKLVGVSDPRPLEGEPLPEFETAAQFAATLPGGGPCAVRLTYSAAWAARLPAALPVYPHGATLEAAGVDSTDCAMRVVTFLTPVPVADLLSFYAARARSGGFTVVHAADRKRHVLSAEKSGAAFRLVANREDDELTRITLATTAAG